MKGPASLCSDLIHIVGMSYSHHRNTQQNKEMRPRIDIAENNLLEVSALDATVIKKTSKPCWLKF